MYKSFDTHDLVVRDISQNVTEDILFNSFSEYGKVVSVKIMKDQYTQVSRGFAFVTFNKRFEGKIPISDRIPAQGMLLGLPRHNHDLGVC